jgi:hypothetical protein
MHMFDRRRRLAASLLAVGLLAATLFAVDALALPSPAEARCGGEGVAVTSWFGYGGTLRVSETPGTGTCNGNNVYTAVLKDERADGYCASVYFKDGIYPWTRAAKICGVGSTLTFQWDDRNGNHQAYEQLCMEPASDPTKPIICGWLNNVDGYALNWGY